MTAALENAIKAVKPKLRGWIHAWSFLVALFAGVVLVAYAGSVSPTAADATAIYTVTIWGLFGISAIYHRITWKTVEARTWMKRADHSMIFLFIAGSYTPFTLLGLPRSTGIPLLIVVWVSAALGVALKMFWPTAPRWVGVPLYIILGWAIVPYAGTLLHTAGVTPMVLLAVGGVIYSVGAILYATKWPNPWPTHFGHHEFFHAATVVAAICHYIAVWFVVAA
ncbi:PAQR family membrane homeostasis protein TrhA [Smaragdicoccus niigatensis]|uniref:PAQR family membrane homeostasis protein TrhA n=1 Tax=Smaragdicoccus niigatensis TaxID=359359 RepID=UPI0039EFB6D4